MMAALDSPRHGLAGWTAAAAGAAVTLTLFYPGFMSPDSADQWLQARTGRYTSVHPPLMAFVWSFTERVVPGPGGLFLLHTVLFWFALGWFSRELFARPWLQAAFVLVIGLWPPVFGTVPHLWKDVPMAAFALLGVAALAHERRRPGRPWLLAAVVFFALACAYRHNALPLVVPFLALIVIRCGVAGWLRRVMGIFVLTLVVAAVAALPERHPAVVERDVWPVTAVWDLAAVSIARQRMLIPPDWRTPDLTLAELETWFRPWSNTTVFDTGKLVISLYTDPTPAQRKSLRAAWLKLWTQAPLDIVRHRLRLTALLFGLLPEQVPLGLKLWLQTPQFPDNPPIAVAPSALRDRLTHGLHALTATPLFAGWLYLLLLAIAAVAGRGRKRSFLFWPMVLSVALYCAPLALFAPSAEFRYLLWPVIATMIVLALRYADAEDPRHSHRRTAAA